MASLSRSAPAKSSFRPTGSGTSQSAFGSPPGRDGAELAHPVGEHPAAPVDPPRPERARSRRASSWWALIGLRDPRLPLEPRPTARAEAVSGKPGTACSQLVLCVVVVDPMGGPSISWSTSVSRNACTGRAVPRVSWADPLPAVRRRARPAGRPPMGAASGAPSGRRRRGIVLNSAKTLAFCRFNSSIRSRLRPPSRSRRR